ncbi:MAG TPA: HAMP domain-containing sensor histidine kinase [Terriglobales bacterium]|nr:HAMP domain-containing sensor histidine kinase [Terriglobales bacterium]
MRMKSLYLAILLAMAGILSFSVVVFFAISRGMEQRYFVPVFDAMDSVEVQDAREMLETRGPDGLVEYMRRLNKAFGGVHYLLDGNGRDVLTGEDLSRYLPKAPLTKWRGHKFGKALVTRRSDDGRYWFLAISPAQPRNAPFYHYYLLVVGASGILCWLAAVYVVSPIRQIAATIKRFGEGDLSARVIMQRGDEIGSLGQSFNSMAERMQKLLLSEQRLLGDVSHELRSPLARLKFSVKLARTAPDRDAALDRVKRDIDRLSTLVSGLVEMTRAEGDPTLRKSEMVCLNDVVAETVRDSVVEVEARGCNIRVTGRLAAKVPGDAELLRRAVENVLRNAIRYSPPNANIDVELSQSDRAVLIAIRDYGTGIPEEFMDRIFDPFFRVEEARDSGTGGVGLGLSIARRSVQLHGGSIAARNAHPGLRVEIKLPAVIVAQNETADRLPNPV